MDSIRFQIVSACMAVLLIAIAGEARGSDCNATSVGFTPISDLGPGLYLGEFSGGLYPNGANTPTQAHHAAGRARALSIGPLDTAGNPDPAGKYVLLSIGMSNTTQEFCSHGGNEPCDAWTFMGRAAVHAQVNDTTLEIVNGARGGQAATAWNSPTDQTYNLVAQLLQEKGLSEAQVQVVWIKQALPGPTVSLPDANADAFVLQSQLGQVVRAARSRYPNLRIAFLSSRIYAGYASTPLNPEPYSYESAFSVKWLIEAQIEQMAGGPVDPIAGNLNYNSVAPWIAWGPYLWADGLAPRSDGLIWECANLQDDGTHPSTSGESKVGGMLLDFMLVSPYSRPWFVQCAGGNPNGAGGLNLDDVPVFVAVLLGADTNPQHVAGSDMNCDGSVNGADIAPFAAALIPG